MIYFKGIIRNAIFYLLVSFHTKMYVSFYFKCMLYLLLSIICILYCYLSFRVHFLFNVLINNYCYKPKILTLRLDFALERANFVTCLLLPQRPCCVTYTQLGQISTPDKFYGINY